MPKQNIYQLAAAGDEWGEAVAMDANGTVLAVGGASVTVNGTSSGAVSVWTGSGTTWTEQQVISPDIPTSNEQFGRAVAMSSDGTTLVIGAPVGGTGKVYVFKQVGASYVQQNVLTPTDSTSVQSFGTSVGVSSSGDTIVIGADLSDLGGLPNIGCAYVFHSSDGGVTYNEAQRFEAGENAGDRSGVSVSINGAGDTIAVGLYLNDVAGIDAGAVKLYTGSGSTWSTTPTTLVSDTPTSAALYGLRVWLSRDGNTLLVGAPGETSGTVYVYVKNGGSWSKETEISGGSLTPGVNSGERFGQCVITNAAGNVIAIGTLTGDSAVSSSGTVYVLTKSQGVWSQKVFVVPQDAETDQRYGYAISINDIGNTIAIGSLLNDATGLNSGSFYTVNAT